MLCLAVVGGYYFCETSHQYGFLWLDLFGSDALKLRTVSQSEMEISKGKVIFEFKNSLEL